MDTSEIYQVSRLTSNMIWTHSNTSKHSNTLNMETIINPTCEFICKATFIIWEKFWYPQNSEIPVVSNFFRHGKKVFWGPKGNPNMAGPKMLAMMQKTQH